MTILFDIGHGMRLWLKVFGYEGRRTGGNLPEVFKYQPKLIGPSEEQALVARIREFSFTPKALANCSPKLTTVGSNPQNFVQPSLAERVIPAHA